MTTLPRLIADDIAALCQQLAQRGYTPERHLVSEMHSYIVDFTGPSAVTIICDRGQLMLDGAQEILEPLGMWRAFDDRDEFAAAVIATLDRLVGAKGRR